MNDPIDRFDDHPTDEHRHPAAQQKTEQHSCKRHCAAIRIQFLNSLNGFCCNAGSGEAQICARRKRNHLRFRISRVRNEQFLKSVLKGLDALDERRRLLARSQWIQLQQRRPAFSDARNFLVDKLGYGRVSGTHIFRLRQAHFGAERRHRAQRFFDCPRALRFEFCFLRGSDHIRQARLTACL